MSDKATLMFVDDEERILRSLNMMFRNEYNVFTTTTGQEALDILRRNRVHVVVSDQRMPAMLGVDLLREVKFTSPNTMRILLTGYADRDAVIESINEGEIFRYISKPWNSEIMRSTISEAALIAMNSEQINPITATTGKQVILVLDEDPTVAELIRMLISRNFGDSFAIEWCTSFESAVAVLGKADVAVTVAELHLAGDDVSVFIKILKSHAPHIVTVVTSSFQDVNTLVSLVNEGQIYRFLPKPLRQGMVSMALSGAIRAYHNNRLRPILLDRCKVEPPKRIEEGTLAWRIKEMLRGLYVKTATAERKAIS